MKLLGGKYALPLIVASALPVVAEKDSNYYPGFTNPNVKNKMYWQDSFNVLQDIDQFEELYIKYHHCVWSPYGSGADEDDVCYNGDADEEEYWYLGRTQCFRANVAYTLYGVLKGESGDSFWGGNKCTRKNYINSFFTTYGVESFAEPFGIDTTYANSYCTADDDDEQDGRRAEDEEDYQHNSMVYGDYTSVGTGCSTRGRFVLNRYKGISCDGNYYEKTIDKLNSFNSAIEDVGCYKVYDSNVYERRMEGDEEDEEGGDENEEEEEEGYEEEEEQEQQDYDENSLAYQILSYSRACSIRQYPRGCPDPFGLKKKYTKASESASGKSVSITKTLLSWFFFLLGILLILLAFVINRRARKLSRMKSKESTGTTKSSKKEKKFLPRKIQFLKKKRARESS